jgi:hypothetical protein
VGKGVAVSIIFFASSISKMVPSGKIGVPDHPLPIFADYDIFLAVNKKK